MLGLLLVGGVDERGRVFGRSLEEFSRMSGERYMWIHRSNGIGGMAELEGGERVVWAMKGVSPSFRSAPQPSTGALGTSRAWQHFSMKYDDCLQKLEKVTSPGTFDETSTCLVRNRSEDIFACAMHTNITNDL